jgi:hypothetical protein
LPRAEVGDGDLALCSVLYLRFENDFVCVGRFRLVEKLCKLRRDQEKSGETEERRNALPYFQSSCRQSFGSFTGSRSFPAVRQTGGRVAWETCASQGSLILTMEESVRRSQVRREERGRGKRTKKAYPSEPNPTPQLPATQTRPPSLPSPSLLPHLLYLPVLRRSAVLLLQVTDNHTPEEPMQLRRSVSHVVEEERRLEAFGVSNHSW